MNKSNLNKKRPNYRMMMQISLCVMAMGLISNVFGIGCGQGFKSASEIDQSSTGPGGFTTEPPGSDLVPMTGVKAAGVPLLSQTYASLVGALQIATPSAASRNEYNNQLVNLSESGRPATIGSSLLVSSMALSAQLCLDKITQEQALAAAQKTIFTAINLAAGPANNVTPDNIKVTVNRLARALWQRDETPAELAALTAGVQESMNLDAANNATETREAALFLCTAMAVSQSGLEL